MFNHQRVVFLLIQNVTVVDQAKIDKLMLDMDGTENKCKMLLRVPFTDTQYNT